MGQASNAPKIRIGTTGARVFAITSPSPGKAGCKFPSGVRAPFRKNERAIASAQNSDQRFERAAIVAFEIDRDDVELRQKPAEDRRLHQRFFRKKIDGAVTGVSGQRRIEITLVIHGENHRAALDHPLPMNDAEAEE